MLLRCRKSEGRGRGGFCHAPYSANMLVCTLGGETVVGVGECASSLRYHFCRLSVLLRCRKSEGLGRETVSRSVGREYSIAAMPLLLAEMPLMLRHRKSERRGRGGFHHAHCPPDMLARPLAGNCGSSGRARPSLRYHFCRLPVLLRCGKLDRVGRGGFHHMLRPLTIPVCPRVGNTLSKTVGRVQSPKENVCRPLRFVLTKQNL